MRILPFLAALLVLRVTSPAAEITLRSPEEQAAWAAIAARFTEAPVVKSDKPKTLELAVSGVRGRTPVGGSASILVEKEGGHVLEVTSNSAGFGDEEFKAFAAFPQLRALTLFHNGGFTGGGLAYITHLAKLESVTLAGGSLTDLGMFELAKIPTLRGLRVFHSKVTDAGVAAFRTHPALESINLSPSWSSLITDKSLESLAQCKALRKIELDETYLTWTGGLRFLAERQEPLTEIKFKKCIIEPAEVERLRQARPATKISWEGLGGGAEGLKKAWLRGPAEKWIPKEMLARVAAEGAKLPPKAEEK